MGSFLYFIGSRFLSGNSTSDTKVTQTEDISTNADYEILSSGTGDNTTRTEESHKSANLIYNPSISKMTLKEKNGAVDFVINNRVASRAMKLDESDITMSGNQYWDGENQSLKTAVNTKVKKEVSNGSTSVDTYFESPYTLLSALPFGDSSLRLDDGTLFVHKDEQIESTAMVLYNNGINCYLLSVDGQTGEVTNVTGIGSWMLNQVGLSVMDIWRNGDSGWVGTDHSLANVLTSLNTSLANKVNKGWVYAAQKTSNSTTPSNMSMKNSVNMQNYNSMYILISWVANSTSYSTSLSFPSLGYTNNYLTKTCPAFGQVYFRWTSPTQMTYHANSTPSGLTNLNIQVYVAKDK